MITALDLDAHRATDDHGNTYNYEKLLLATGSTPRDPGLGDHQVINFRSLDDYRHLRSMAEQGKTIAVIGGGFIGSELAASLTTNDKAVTMIFPEETIVKPHLPARSGPLHDRVLPREGRRRSSPARVDASAWRRRTARSRSGFATQDTGAEQEIAVDGVVAGIGARPNVELAAAAGLDVDNGIVVDDLLRTSHPDVYAAGDVASFRQPALGGRRRVEHEDNAKSDGQDSPAATWPVSPSPTTTCRSSTRTCSTWATRRSAMSTPASRPWPTGRAVPEGRHLLPGGRARARRAALERLGSGRRGPGADHGGRARSRRRDAARPDSGGRMNVPGDTMTHSHNGALDTAAAVLRATFHALSPTSSCDRFEGYAAEMFAAFGMEREHALDDRHPAPLRAGHARRDGGYDGDPKLLTVFETECQGGPDCRLSQVIEGPISFYALCEHHALPFYGRAYVGYIAHEHIIGISKLTRLVRLFARRFSVQERIGQQIADTLEAMLEPHGVAVYLEAHHICIQMRGVEEPASLTRTTFWRGEYDANPALRCEFMAACGLNR